jgi:hypothetical protein
MMLVAMFAATPTSAKPTMATDVSEIIRPVEFLLLHVWWHGRFLCLVAIHSIKELLE